jgi:hypothetical protein
VPGWRPLPEYDRRRRPDPLTTESTYCKPILSLARTLFGPGVEFGDREYKVVRRHAAGHHRVERPTARGDLIGALGEDRSPGARSGPGSTT